MDQRSNTKRRDNKKRRTKNVKEPMTLFQWIVSIISGLFVKEEKAIEKEETIKKKVIENVSTTNKRALLIGSNFEGTQDPLDGCINDLKNMNSFLKKNGFTDIIMVSDDEPLKKPNKANILKELNDFLNQSRAGETLYIHFSGHGVQQRTFDRDEDDYMNEMICTYEENHKILFISDNDLNKIITTSLNKDAKLYVVFDCCHSGSMLDLKYTYQDTLNDWFKSDIISDAKECGHIIMMSGCRDDQKSQDSFIIDRVNGIGYQGAITCSLLNALRTEKEIGQIYKKTLQYLYDNNYEQYPLLSTNKPFAMTSDFL
jgi:hypothetical protein